MALPKKLKPSTSFYALLRDQIGNEFTASQQYVAVAVWFDANDLPRLAAHFYRQSLEERNHAMMMVRYLIDRGEPVVVPGVGDVRNDFGDVEELIALALQQERDVADEIDALMAAARADKDYHGEQFVHWFLAEQVEEIAQMSTLLNVVRRARGNMFDVENFLAREQVAEEPADASAPRAAGGAL
ncbi:MAG: ferritin [Actinocatenispora sp.]